MDRPYVICHMTLSLDSKVTGSFLYAPECESATALYYQINRSWGADAFACGRVTMEGSFTRGWYPACGCKNQDGVLWLNYKKREESSHV